MSQKFIYSFRKYWVTVHYIPGPVLDVGDRAVNKTGRNSRLHGVYIQVGEAGNKNDRFVFSNDKITTKHDEYVKRITHTHRHKAGWGPGTWMEAAIQEGKPRESSLQNQFWVKSWQARTWAGLVSGQRASWAQSGGCPWLEPSEGGGVGGEERAWGWSVMCQIRWGFGGCWKRFRLFLQVKWGDMGRSSAEKWYDLLSVKDRCGCFMGN